MKKSYMFLAFLTNLNIGLVVPILGLMLCEHGCTVQNVGLAVTAFAITVLVAEVPSGIFADLFGRKLSFALSHIVGIIMNAIFLLADSFFLVAGAMMFRGISMAFSSGSLDALVVEEAQERLGETGINKAVSQFQMCSSIGVASGALIASMIPYKEGYQNHLLLSVIVCVLLSILSYLGITEKQVNKEKTEMRLQEHIRSMYGVFAQSAFMKKIAVCLVVIALTQASVETYWQLRLAEIYASNVQKITGVLSAIAYLATMIGCFLMGKIESKDRKGRWNNYILVAMGGMIFIIPLALADNSTSFSVFYILIYLFIGMIAVSEQTIINSEIEDNVRASILSVTSFLARMGGILSGVIGSLILVGGSISVVWIIFAALAVGVLLIKRCFQ